MYKLLYAMVAIVVYGHQVRCQTIIELAFCELLSFKRYEGQTFMLQTRYDSPTNGGTGGSTQQTDMAVP